MILNIIDPTVYVLKQIKNRPIRSREKDIYQPTIDYFKAKYNMKLLSVSGLVVGTKGTIHVLFFTGFTAVLNFISFVK